MLRDIVDNKELRERCYNTGKDFVELKTGSRSNACAAVASSYLIEAGVLNKIEINTGELLEELLSTQLIDEIVFLIADIEAGDILFSCDMKGMWMPDHVSICHHKDASNNVWVVDNYNVSPRPRNMRAGSKTAFAFGLRVL